MLPERAASSKSKRCGCHGCRACAPPCAASRSRTLVLLIFVVAATVMLQQVAFWVGWGGTGGGAARRRVYFKTPNDCVVCTGAARPHTRNATSHLPTGVEPVPASAAGKVFYSPGYAGLSWPRRQWRSLGWNVTESLTDIDDAYVVWLYGSRQKRTTKFASKKNRQIYRDGGLPPNRPYSHAAKPWQVHSNLQDAHEIDFKDLLYVHMRELKEQLRPLSHDPPLWVAPSGAVLDFDVSQATTMPQTYLLTEHDERVRFLQDTEASVLRASEAPDADLDMPLLLKDSQSGRAAGIVIVSSGSQLLQLRDEVTQLDSGWASYVPGGLLGRKGHTYVVQRYINNQLMLRKTWPDGRVTSHLFYQRSYMAVISIDPPVVMAHPGFASGGRAVSPESKHSATVMLPNAVHNKSERVIARAVEAVSSLLEELYPNHPDPTAYAACQIQRTLATAWMSVQHILARKNGAGDRYWLFGCDLVWDDEGNTFLVEVNEVPTMLPRSTVPVLDEVGRTVYPEWLKLVTEVARGRLEGRPNYPLKGARVWKPIVLGGSTEAPACQACRDAGAEVPMTK